MMDRIWQVLSSPRRAFLVTLVAGLALLNIAVFIGGAFRPRLDLVSSFAPVILAVAGLVLVFAWLVRERWIAFVALLGAVFPPAFVIALDVIGAIHRPAPHETVRVKVMTFNLWSQNNDLGAVEALVRSEKPQILLLQEASSKRYRGLLENLSYLYPTHVSNDRINCATHVFSSYTLLEHLKTRECNLVMTRLAMPAALGGGELSVSSVHLSRDKAHQAAATQRVMTEWADQSAIVGGDFNRTPWSWSLRTFDAIDGFDRRTHAMPTWPTEMRAEKTWLTTPFAVLPLDHVFATRDWATIAVRRGPASGSDHYPVIVELGRALP